MSQSRTQLLRLEGFAGGLNDTDPPHRIGDDQLTVATDVELTASGGLRRRDGIARAFAQPATEAMALLARHTPSNTLSSTEVWAIPRSATNFYRSTTGTTWTTVSASDAGASSYIVDAASFNGKLFVAYEKNASTDRLHCWDGTSIRRVGISTPAAATVGNTGAGTYGATLRYYKIQFYYELPSGKYTFSDLSAAVSFTPSGTGTHARVTKPTTVDGATFWRIWGSADDVSYYLLQSVAIGTTTWDDNTNPVDYVLSNVGNIAAEAGAYTPPWSAKYLLVDENRLLIAGAHETMRYASRIGWSAILGTAAAAYGESVTVNDDERFPPNQYLDLDSDEGGEITGMEMLNGSVYVFKRYAIYKLVRTGDSIVPYKPLTITKVVGAMSRRSIVPGEDESGAPCLYFLSDRGPYRLGGGGLQYLGGDIETVWATVRKNIVVPPHGIYYPKRGQVRWWVCVGQDIPNTQLIFHVRLARPSGAGRVSGGWTRGGAAKANDTACSAMLPDDLSSRDSELAPYAIHYNGSYSYPPVVWKYTSSQASDDVVHTTTGAITSTETFTPTATTKAFNLGMGDQAGVRDVYVSCLPSAGGTTLSASLIRDFGAETRTASRAFTGTTTRLPQQITDLTMANAQFAQVSLTSTTQTAFTVDDVVLRVSREEPV